MLLRVKAFHQRDELHVLRAHVPQGTVNFSPGVLVMSANYRHGVKRHVIFLKPVKPFHDLVEAATAFEGFTVLVMNLLRPVDTQSDQEPMLGKNCAQASLIRMPLV